MLEKDLNNTLLLESLAKNATGLRAYRLIVRRALLQDVRASERAIAKIKASNDTSIVAEILASWLEDHRKALLQIVRDTEKVYGISKSKRRQY